MTQFIIYSDRISALTAEAKTDFSSKLKTKSFKKGEFINKEGQICRNLYFIERGLAKHYYFHKGRIFILRFFDENQIFTSIDSFVNQSPAEFMTVALEDMETTYLDFWDVEDLCKKHHSFETFIRKVFTVISLNSLKRLKEMFDKDASELYTSFLNENHHLMQRVSLGDIASYLGISQVSLSRIRAKNV